MLPEGICRLLAVEITLFRCCSAESYVIVLGDIKRLEGVFNCSAKVVPVCMFVVCEGVVWSALDRYA